LIKINVIPSEFTTFVAGGEIYGRMDISSKGDGHAKGKSELLLGELGIELIAYDGPDPNPPLPPSPPQPAYTLLIHENQNLFSLAWLCWWLTEYRIEGGFKWDSGTKSHFPPSPPNFPISIRQIKAG
jgi:hypothetical protein